MKPATVALANGQTLFPLQRPTMDARARKGSPLCDFPIRDEVLFQFLSLPADADVLEIGPGSGVSAYWLSPQVRRLVLSDIAGQTLNGIAHQLSQRTNIEYLEWDLSRPGLSGAVQGQFDAVFALDMFEFVSDPEAALRNVTEVLRPAGMMLISYPNFTNEKAHGINCIATRSRFDSILKSAGFDHWEIFTLRMRPGAQRIFNVAHEWPIRWHRRRRKTGTGLPLDYDATWSFQQRGRLERFKPWLNRYWNWLGKAMRAGGDLYVRHDVGEDLENRQIVVRAWRQ